MTSRRFAGTVLVAVVTASACRPNINPSFSFALLGDNPYGEEYVPRFEALIDHVNNASPAWVLHVGDLKGTEPCSDELLTSRFTLFQRFRAPLLFTPGDNDWYDCREDRMGSFDSYDRLTFLRQLFYAGPVPDLANSTPVERQSDVMLEFGEFVENAMWIRDGVVFATVHLVVTQPPPPDSAMASRRLDGALAWLARAFDVGNEVEARGVFIAMQADPWPASGLPFVLETLLSCVRCVRSPPGLEAIHPLLVTRVRSFGRPVVLAVGDTHVYRVDKPLRDAETGLMVENFTRVETFGHPDVHWVKVTVDSSSATVFSFEQQLVPANVR